MRLAYVPNMTLPRQSASWSARSVFACDPFGSRGRLLPEDICPTRSDFQRDRDRIVHCNAFRRLTYKTQVFLHHEGDLYRTRLTHSIEVAQIARALARGLGVDEDLAEAIALAHDLGHPPFGHAGERALNEAMADHGGFDHNAQSLKVVTALEHRYAAFDGLNLTWETLEGLVKHNGPMTNPDGYVAAYNAKQDLRLAEQTSIEAQIAALADDIAYNNHDLDDGLRAHLVSIDALRDIPLCRRQLEDVEAIHPDISEERTLYEVNRRMITVMITDILTETRSRLKSSAPMSDNDVRKAGSPMVQFSTAMQSDLSELRRFLFSNVYRNDKVMLVMDNAAKLVTDLVRLYLEQPEKMPTEWASKSNNASSLDDKADIVRDFIAGMTDHYAIKMHRAEFDRTPDLG